MRCAALQNPKAICKLLRAGYADLLTEHQHVFGCRLVYGRMWAEGYQKISDRPAASPLLIPVPEFFDAVLG